MAKFRAACPHCGKVYRVDEAHVGQSARCHGCSRTFVLTRAVRQDVGALVAALGRDLEPGAPRADPRAAARAVAALARIGEPAVQALVRALRHTVHAHEALGRIGGEEAFKALCGELNTDDPDRVIAAAGALSQIADPRAIAALKRHRWSRGHEVRAAVAHATAAIEATLREMLEGRWFQVDREHPGDQVQRVSARFQQIAHDPELTDRALRWHHDFCAAMPQMRFASDAERAETWRRLGGLIFQLLNPDKELVFVDGRPTIECPEAAFCFAQSRKLHP